MTVLSAIEIADAVRGGRITAMAATEAALERIARDDREVNAFVAVDAELALAAARRVDLRRAAGDDPGPLAGVPIGVKDNEPVAGLPTRHGSLLHEHARPEAADSEHVSRLRAAGAVPLGKVAQGEFGMDAITYTLLHGVTRNPWNLERTPGGSSGGSGAAVAAGLVPLCTGSDALGSIRAPGAFNGLIGLKPTHGRIPRAHGFKDTACLGPLSMTAADAARYLDVVSGPSNRDRMSLPAPAVRFEDSAEGLDVSGLRASWSADLGFAPVEPEVIEICAAAFERLARAARLEVVSRQVELVNVYPEWNALAALELMGDFELAGVLPDHLDRISPTPRDFIQSVKHLSPSEQAAYRAHIRRLEAEMADFFETSDLLFTPATCCAAYSATGPLPTVIAGKDASHTNAEPFTAIGSVCWLPSITLPAGVTSEGLPVGLLLNARRGADEVALRLARIWEQTQPWPLTAPRQAMAEALA